MTLEKATTRTREFARTSANAATDENVMDFINEAMNAFARDVGEEGLHKSDYLTITPKFTTKTNFAIRITITGGTNALAATDVAITAANRDGVAGATIATDLQAALRAAVGAGANLTVAWNTATWRFTIDSIDGTVIKIESPIGTTYVDATILILGGATTGTQTLVSGFPQDCTKEIDLPADFVSIEDIEWDNDPLISAMHSFITSPECYGDPAYYFIANKKLYLNPVPSRQKSLQVWYKYKPVAFTDAAGQAATELPIDEIYQMAIVHKAAALIAEGNYEPKTADRNLGLYEQIKNSYIVTQANNNPSMNPRTAVRLNFGIDRSTL